MTEEITDEELSDRHQAFVDEYCISRNATEAYQKVYDCSYEVANARGPLLKNKPEIAVAIVEKLEDIAKRSEITQDDILRELGKIAFQDVRKLYDKEGNLLPVHLLDDDTAASIAGIEVVEMAGAAEIGGEAGIKHKAMYTKKVKSWDKRLALVDYGKYFGMFKDTVAHTGPGGGPIQNKITYEIVDPKETKEPNV